MIWLDSHSILTKWRKYLFQLFNVHGVSDVRQTEIHTAEPPVPEPSAFQVEMAIENVKRHKSPGIDQMPAAEIKAGCRTILYEIHNLLILFGIKRNCMRSRSSPSLYLFIRRRQNRW